MMEWEETTLGEVLKLEYGKSLSKKKRSGSGYPVYGSNGEVGRHDEFLVEGPGIVVGRKGSHGAINWVEENFFPIDTTYYVVPSGKISIRLAKYLLESINLKSLNRSTAIPGLNRNDAYNLIVSIPPVIEQDAFINRLDDLSSRFDLIKKSFSRLPSLLSDFRESVLRKAITGTLTEGWSKKASFESVVDLLDRVPAPPRPNRFKSRSTSVTPGRFAISVGKPDKEIADRYEWVPLYRVAQMASGHTPSRKHPEYWGGDVDWIGIRDAGAHHGKTIYQTAQQTNQLGLENSASVLLPENTVCFSRTASVGYVVKMGSPMATSQDFVNWVCTEAVDPDWLKWLLVAEVDSMKGFGKGSTHTTIYYPELLSLHVALPPLEEQREIVRRVEKLFSFADRVEEQVDALRAQVLDLPQAVLGRAFRGEL